MVDTKVYIWVEDATREYKRSRAWLDKQLREGRLTYAKFEGDRRVYLKRAELDAILGKPIEERRRGADGEQVG